jgi:hypothetical protein
MTGSHRVAPFFPGTLDPRAAYLTAGGLLVEEHGSGAPELQLLHPSGASPVLASGALAPPALGRGLALEPMPAAPGRADDSAARAHTAPTIRLALQQGDALVSPRLRTIVQAPPGVRLSAEQRGAIGISLFVATTATTAIPILRLDDGTLHPLAPDPELKEARLTAALGVVLNGSRLEYHRAGSTAVLSTAAVRIVLS